MKIKRCLKLLHLLMFMAVLNNLSYGQTAAFTPDAKTDSAWIAQSIITANKLHAANLDTNGQGHGAWIDGKVLYCPDGSLRATQLTAGPRTFTTALQFSYQGKIFQQDLSYHDDFSGYTLNSIQKLPGEKPAYLFLFVSVQDTVGDGHDWLAEFKQSGVPRDTDFNHIKDVHYVAAAFRLEKDSLFETTFPLTVAQQADTANLIASKSFGFDADIKQEKDAPRPFLKYDPLTHKLSFFDIEYRYNEASEPLFQMDVESAAFKYKDTSFVLAEDTTYQYPSLESLTKILARHNYRAGKYLIKAWGTKTYEDFSGDVFPVLTVKYKIGADTLTSYDDSGYDGSEEVNIKPDYRIQPNSSLILLLENETNYHAPGMCGAADYFDSYFWLIDHRKSPQQLFSFSWGSCSSAITYTYTQKGKEISGSFYVSHPFAKDEIAPDIRFENSYWKDSSTYVLVFNDQEDAFSRSFYLHFSAADKEVPVRLLAGQLHRVRKKAGQ
jgi:hypothetical protein